MSRAYNALLADHASEFGVLATASWAPAVGGRVLARYQASNMRAFEHWRTRWYPGTVTAVHEDGTAIHLRRRPPT
jgi:hypothetical protein